MNIRHYISFFIKNVIKMLTLLIGVSIARVYAGVAVSD